MEREFASYRSNSFSQYNAIDRSKIFSNNSVAIGCRKFNVIPSESISYYVRGEFVRSDTFVSRVNIYVQENESGGSQVFIFTSPVASNGVVANGGNSIPYSSWHRTTGREEYIKTQELITEINDGELARVDVDKNPKNRSGVIAKPGAPQLTGSGTGFFITSAGHIATNYHVIKDCQSVVYKNETLDIEAVDPINDLAILRSSSRHDSIATISSGQPKLASEVMVYGYPLASILGTDITVTKGEVTSLSGIKGDYSRFTLSAPIQPGNSGGPIVNEDNEVVGIIVSTLDNIKLSQEAGIQSQNVNFGIRASLLKNMMEANSIMQEKTTPKKKSDEYQKATIFLKCFS
jgi:S1-C subfamily serine protease